MDFDVPNPYIGFFKFKILVDVYPEIFEVNTDPCTGTATLSANPTEIAHVRQYPNFDVYACHILNQSECGPRVTPTITIESAVTIDNNIFSFPVQEIIGDIISLP